MQEKANKLFPEIETVIKGLELKSISNDRKETLTTLIDHLQTKVDKNESIRLNFICTHNSRRSHLSQVWAQTMAHYFDFDTVTCYSGGTESTAVYPMVIETLEHNGFKIEKLSVEENPIYSIKYSPNSHPLIAFSKKLDDDFNPSSGFIAIMTCDSANEACPIVRGAEIRIPITYQDPKAYDNTPQQAAKYEERSLQIATELFYVFSNLKP